MENRFARMDDEVNRRSQSNQTFTCRCELQTPHYDVVRSTAVVAIVTSDKLVVSNCGDSRAVLCRKGVAIPLSYDHKKSSGLFYKNPFFTLKISTLFLLQDLCKIRS
ncbi:hypothetical protein JHK87_005446 [Glycine soja]|nr:hypothetical protein JHK87_005446 [Glycine soja]